MDINTRKELVKIALFASQELEAAIKELYPDLDPGEDLWSINFNLNNDAAILNIPPPRRHKGD